MRLLTLFWTRMRPRSAAISNITQYGPAQLDLADWVMSACSSPRWATFAPALAIIFLWFPAPSLSPSLSPQ